MAGMLPGVESARRRRFHGGSGWSVYSPTSFASGSTRRSSFCLYVSNHESFINSSSSLQKRNMMNQPYHDEKLGEVAREAKERLDEKLRATHNRKEKPKRTSSQERLKGVEEARELQTDLSVFGLKKNGSKRLFSWGKLSWKASDQDECAVCLDKFKNGETLTHLPCAHRFHSRCLVPWLENNAHCPCCRMGIFT